MFYVIPRMSPTKVQNRLLIERTIFTSKWAFVFYNCSHGAHNNLSLQNQLLHFYYDRDNNVIIQAQRFLLALLHFPPNPIWPS